MPFYSAFLVEPRRSWLETDLATSLVSTLAGWDPHLCEFLAPLELTELIEPKENLSSFARQRGWSPDEDVQVNSTSWQEGQWQTVEGRPKLHTSLSITSGEIYRLVWKAEVGVLLPYIEEQRQILLERYGCFLSVPFVTNQGVRIEDRRDLEIGMIQYQLRNCPAIEPETKSAIADLKKARNSLAHLEPVEPAVVLSICEHESSV